MLTDNNRIKKQEQNNVKVLLCNLLVSLEKLYLHFKEFQTTLFILAIVLVTNLASFYTRVSLWLASLCFL